MKEELKKLDFNKDGSVNVLDIIGKQNYINTSGANIRLEDYFQIRDMKEAIFNPVAPDHPTLSSMSAIGGPTTPSTGGTSTSSSFTVPLGGARYGVGSLLSDADWANVTANVVTLYDPVAKQVIVIWDGSSAGTGGAFIYSFRSQGWYKVTDFATQSTNLTNSVLGRANLVYIGGGASSNNISVLGDRSASATHTIDLRTKDIYFENVESLKNLTQVSITYKGGSSTSISVQIATNSGSSYTSIGTLSDATGDYVNYEIDTTGVAAVQSKKSFSIKLSGTARGDFDLQDISLVYRNLGLR